MPANQALLDTIANLVSESGHEPADILESVVVLAGCTMQACDVERLTVMNHDSTQSFTLINNKKE